MAVHTSQRAPPDGDLTYRKLTERVVAGDESAWQEFVERFSSLIFSLLWRYASGDRDLCGDLYLYVIEALCQTSETGETFYRLRRYLASVDQYDGKGRLTTWLGRVTQNLVSDYFRGQEGRRTLPRAIGRLDLTHQQIFKLLYWDCLPEHEACSVMDAQHGGFDREAFDQAVLSINRSLKNCNRWSIYSELIRRTPALPIHPISTESQDGSQAVQIADPNPASRPYHCTVARLERTRAEAIGRQLCRAIRELSEERRLLLLCRFRHGMTAGQIANLLGRTDDKRIYIEIDRLKEQLKKSLQSGGFEWEEIAGGLWALDGLLDELETERKREEREE